MIKLKMSLDEKFSVTRSVIIRTKLEIDADEWYDYFSENLSSIDKHSRILVLTGYHGLMDGTVGEKDSEMHEAIDFAADILFKDHENILKEKSISRDHFKVEDIGEFGGDDSEFMIDSFKFRNAVEKFNPTMICLAFCYTQNNQILNQILWSGGIYSKLILTQDRREITFGKCFSLDKEQQEIIKLVTSSDYKDFILAGKLPITN